MKFKQRLRKAAGVLLILMLASGAQAATVVHVETDFMRGTETRIFPFEIAEGRLFKATRTDFEFPAPIDALSILKGKEIGEGPLLDSEIFKFQTGPGISTAAVIGRSGG